MDHWAGCYDDPYAVARIKQSVKLLDAQPGHVVLDVGCYTQEAKKYLDKRINYFGIDSKSYVPETFVMDIDGGFKAGPTPRILCLEVLEHLKDPQGTLKSIRECLTDDGIAVISLPNEATLFHRVRALLGTVDAECFSNKGKHLHLPSLRQCRAFLRGEFEIVEEDYYLNLSGAGSRQPQISTLLRLVPKRILLVLARLMPSLFARGFIFVCKH